MKIETVSILGLGAEGSIAFRALLGKPCHVRILARGARAERLQSQGVTINGIQYPLHVAQPGEEPPPQLLIVAVKSYQLESALDDISAETGPETVVMSLMNGLTSEEVLGNRLGAEHIIYCMSRLNAKRVGQHVEFQPVGSIYIGEKDGMVSDRVQSIHDLLDGWVPCVISREIVLDIWRKYMFNAACNTVQAILRATHLWFQKLPEACAALECVMREIVLLGNAVGVPLSQADIRALDGYFLPYPADGMCSMAQDILDKRPTEIDMLIGEALELGQAHGMELPVCRFVYHMVKTLEQVNAGALEGTV